jgi:hypothetical protein
MSGLLWFSKVPEGPASPLWCMAGTPFALMQQCRPKLWHSRGKHLGQLIDHVVKLPVEIDVLSTEGSVAAERYRFITENTVDPTCKIVLVGG